VIQHRWLDCVFWRVISGLGVGFEMLLYVSLSSAASKRYFHVDKLVGNLQGINEIIVFIELRAYRVDPVNVVFRYRSCLIQHM